MFHVKHPPWAERAAAVGVSLSPAQAGLLDRYHELLHERAVPLGMIAAADRELLAERHILDGLRGVPAVDRADRAVDLGSGAGIPGIPIAIALPEVAVVLAEARRNRAAFLEAAVDLLPLPNAVVHAGRAQELAAGSFDVALARAFADVAGCWAIATRLLKPTGRLLYWAGRSFSPGDVPAGIRSQVLSSSALANAGPVVIMSAL